MQEEWKPIKSYEGCYEVSNLGRIRNRITGKELKSSKCRKGYMNIICFYEVIKSILYICYLKLY